jgi:hypothetical protein
VDSTYARASATYRRPLRSNKAEAQFFDQLRYYFFKLKRRRSARTWQGVLAKGTPKEDGGTWRLKESSRPTATFARTPGQVRYTQSKPSTAPQKGGRRTVKYWYGTPERGPPCEDTLIYEAPEARWASKGIFRILLPLTSFALLPLSLPCSVALSYS